MAYASILGAISMYTINPRVTRGSNVSMCGVNMINSAANGPPGVHGAWLAPLGALAARSDFRARVILVADHCGCAGGAQQARPEGILAVNPRQRGDGRAL